MCLSANRACCSSLSIYQPGGDTIDAEELDKHLKETPYFIQQHRARMNPTNYSYSDAGSGCSGFGPKSPTNETAMERADEEAAIVGNIALYCMGIGSIPRVSMKGFWRVNGVCKGMAVGGLPGVRRVCEHLRIHLGDVLATEGIDDFLRQADDIRALSLHMFPNENTDWLTVEEAVEYTGKAERTIYSWLEGGLIPTLDDRWGRMISRKGLDMMQGIVLGNMMRRMNEVNNRRS